ncbi:CFC_HP_G0013540.mRNA.1.CDS.1 [Saccharomyces cerevisiae]|nr:CFC_HP_G0076820.mRNA.1.CDS.1 [Saccharomyces cerevisiae]CAI5014613.1 CFC_HP_G0013540.mRNA.1.CDS.1 [Saccharomyces cerevisiae]CAI6727214.1 CFC_HP_G0076820.mRNA.1.CDS.1 [Saccharomyces cerevisiae]CAI6931328.1 CFC_HP_G0013540.mRNA.1.CDS.1 [Saccharomyces cerevisiae]CAI7443659.1 CFC_collapsed_G0045780.mRNA.1.CDS.1 [Saccharomyces cerevisiae]
MVELTEIKDDVVQLDEPQFSRNQAIVEEKASATNNDVVDDEDDSDSDFEDEFDENETLLDRIVALKDIVPPGKRQTISNFFGFTSSFVRNAFTKSGNFAWTLTTTALLLGVPLSLSILAEQQLIEMEKTFDLQSDANNILAQGEKDAAATAN